MNTSKELIASAKNELENNTSFAGLVGNRMHFPMLITMNGDSTTNANNIFSKAFKRMWPQTCNHIVFVQNLLNNHFVDLKTGSAMSSTQLQNQLDQIRLTRDVFESMLKWCVYNIIDTSQIKTIEEFKAQFELIDDLNNIVINNNSSMLIVLLDESSLSMNLAKKIREFLANELTRDSLERKYNGTLIISNKTISCEMYNLEELLQIVAGIIILSNNDAITHDDDDIYKERYNCLFDNNGLTVAYSLLKRPNEKIALQILDRFLKNVEQRYLNKTSTMEIEDWRRCFELNRGGITFIDSELEKLSINIDINLLQAMPLKSIPNYNTTIENTTFSQYAQYLFEDSFHALVNDYINKNLKDSDFLSSLLLQYERLVKSRITAKDCLTLNEEKISYLMKEISPAKPNASLSVKDYFVSSVKYYIKHDIVLPFFQDLLKRLSSSANQTINSFYDFIEDFQSQIPISGFDELGIAYRNIADNYCSSPAGETELLTVISPENNIQDFIEILNEMFLHAISFSAESFELSFLDEWQLRLDMKGDEIFKEIQSTFNNDFNKKRFLYGNFAISKALDCYMFHLFDKEKNNSTILFNYFKRAFEGVEHTQFVNTGYNDTVEAFRFLDCSGNKLIL